MRRYCFALIENNCYSNDDTYDDINELLNIIKDFSCSIAVLDALSLEYLYSLEFH